MQYKKGLQIEAGGQRERCSVLKCFLYFH